MMRIRIIITMLIVLFAENRQEAFGQSADTLSVADKAIRTASLAAGFRGEVWNNPALYYCYTPYTWTRLGATGIYNDRGNASLRQEGNEDTYIGADVNSFVILSERDLVFGSAGYRSEKQENVLWNENIDWELVAPYVTGDSIGGFLKGETYYFNGGYAYESGKWTWGITGGYRASHNYRDKDPRPRNTSSDLSLDFGTGYNLGTHRLGFSAGFRLYQQNSEISFLSDKGSTSVYHMLGLGMDYVRFAGSRTGTKYQGTGWRGNIGLLPADTKQGISATVSVSHLSIAKKLSGANNLTLMDVNTTDLKGNVTWMREPGTSEHLAVKLDADYTFRKGTENIYGEAGGSSYGELISTSPGIKVMNGRIALSGLWEKLLTGNDVWGGAILPGVVYHRLSADYDAVSRFVHLSAMEGSMCARIQYRMRQVRFTAETDGSYYANLSAEHSFPGLNHKKSSAQALLANVDYLSDSYSKVGISLKADYPMPKQYDLFLSFQWQTVFYKTCGTARCVTCSAGIFF